MLLSIITYLKLTAGLGLEPKYYAPEAYVLPLDDPAKLAKSASKCYTNYK